jgi:fused signal recognition particle receptor
MISLFGKPEPTLLERLKTSVSKTKTALSETVDNIFLGEKQIDPASLKHLESALLSADLGVKTTREILDSVKHKLDRQALCDTAQLKNEIKSHIMRILQSPNGKSDEFASAQSGSNRDPRVIFIVGVNGVGKTTSIGKLANRLRQQNLNVVLCAADTFRAAAIEQLEIWAKRNGVEVIKQKRTAAKVIPGAPHDILLVMDATTGQNGLAQAREFTGAVGVTGIVLTKLDGTAKGGIVVAISRELGLPIRFVGTGEQINDMVPFDAETYAASLFD